MSAVETAQHGFKAHTDGDWDHRIPVQTRSERFKSTDVGAFPEVTGRESFWKFAPIESIRPLLTADLDGSRPPIHAADTPGLSLEWVSRESDRIGRAGIPEDRAAAAAWSGFEEAAVLTISGDEPVRAEVVREDLGAGARAAHLVIEAQPNTRGLVILEHRGSAQLTENVEIVVGVGAQLAFVTLQQWEEDAVHLSSHHATVGRDASLTHIVVSLGGRVVRVNPSIHLNHNGANGEAYGAYFADAGQHLEQQVFMDHDAEHTRSRVLYKGALQGAGARTVWIGDVLIRRNATGTDTYEANNNLVLSDGTRADSIPNLEIQTGDIEGGGHASTTGRFDDEHIFYLQSRGISEEEARKLVVRGFLVEVFAKIGDPATEERLQAAVEAELELGALAGTAAKDA